MIRYKATTNETHPYTGKPCNKVIIMGCTVYDTFNYCNTGKLCSLSITIDKVMKSLDGINPNDTLGNIYNCLYIYPGVH